MAWKLLCRVDWTKFIPSNPHPLKNSPIYTQKSWNEFVRSFSRMSVRFFKIPENLVSNYSWCIQNFCAESIEPNLLTLIHTHSKTPQFTLENREMNLCAVFLECQCDFSKSLRIWCQPTHDGLQTFVPSRLDHFGRIFWKFSTSIQNRSFKPNGFWS